MSSKMIQTQSSRPVQFLPVPQSCSPALCLSLVVCLRCSEPPFSALCALSNKSEMCEEAKCCTHTEGNFPSTECNRIVYESQVDLKSSNSVFFERWPVKILSHLKTLLWARFVRLMLYGWFQSFWDWLNWEVLRVDFFFFTDWGPFPWFSLWYLHSNL